MGLMTMRPISWARGISSWRYLESSLHCGPKPRSVSGGSGMSYSCGFMSFIFVDQHDGVLMSNVWLVLETGWNQDLKNREHTVLSLSMSDKDDGGRHLFWN